MKHGRNFEQTNISDVKTSVCYYRYDITFKNSFRLPKVAKDCPSLPDLIWLFQLTLQQLHTMKTMKALFYKVIKQIPLNRKKQKNNSWCLHFTFNDWLIIIDCQILLQHWVHSQCQMCRYFPNAGCPVTFPTPDVQIPFPTPAILVFLPALGN